MAKGVNRALKSKVEKAEIKKEKKDKEVEKKEQKNIENAQEPSIKNSRFTPIFIRASGIILLLFVWSSLYINKYIPYKRQNEMLVGVLQDPELILHTVKVASKYEQAFNQFMAEKEKPERLDFFKKITYDDVPVSDDEEVTEKDEEVPVQKVAETDILPEKEDDVEVIGDMKEEIMGGEIYTVDEIFEKLGIKKIDEYKPYTEYENSLLKEFRLDREPPEHIVKKADYYKPIIERGLKNDERFFVKKINDKKGYGLFANVDILPHEVLGVYTGVIQFSESEKGKKYEWYYSTIPDRKKEAMIELRVNGKNEGSALRFVNHSMFYNSRIEYVPYNNQWYILFVSNRFISRGEEITVNYREKTKRMPEKIINKWDKVEYEEYQKLYEEYMKLRAENEQAQEQVQETAQEQSTEEPVRENVKEEL